MGAKVKADWEAIERDYRTGRFTLRELGEKYGVLYTTIAGRAKRGQWKQDLADAVRSATSAALIADLVEQGVDKSVQVVQVAAEINKQVILQHRSDITKTREVALSLLNELRVLTVNSDELERLLEMAQSEDMTEEQVEEMRANFRKLMSLGGRTGSLQKLADTMTKLQALERKAFDLDAPKEEQKGDPMSELMGFLQGGAAKLRPGAR